MKTMPGRRKLLRAAGSVALVLGLAAPGRWLHAAQPAADRSYAELESRMAGWVRSLRDKDVQAFLECYSKDRPSFYQSTLSGAPRRAEAIAFSKLQADLAARTGWYEVFFDAGGDDVFRDHVVDDGGKRWRRHGSTFTPPRPDAAGTVSVRWRRERGVWVIDRVAEPSS